MALLVPDVGEEIALKALVNHTPGQDLVLRLYTNNITPSAADTAATYTEAAGSGYAAINLAGATWVYTAGNPGSIAFAEQTFIFTGALGNVYGYYLTQVTSGILVWAERFVNAPWVVSLNGDKINVPPTITATS